MLVLVPQSPEHDPKANHKLLPHHFGPIFFFSESANVRYAENQPVVLLELLKFLAACELEALRAKRVHSLADPLDAAQRRLSRRGEPAEPEGRALVETRDQLALACEVVGSAAVVDYLAWLQSVVQDVLPAQGKLKVES